MTVLVIMIMIMVVAVGLMAMMVADLARIGGGRSDRPLLRFVRQCRPRLLLRIHFRFSLRSVRPAGNLRLRPCREAKMGSPRKPEKH
ncbi:hypothetical protein [Pannonibacter phragmitetus]|uniref:hypothetical protein n=1 Tax=Pannonibacter phragmitetus TaxID=121719 RepID=UPI00197D0EBF|nr:hypothetical protein [Pannonibacter phragmitetus]